MKILSGDCLTVLPTLDANSVDAVVTIHGQGKVNLKAQMGRL